LGEVVAHRQAGLTGSDDQDVVLTWEVAHALALPGPVRSKRANACGRRGGR
jgi:hypothetical protein